VALKGLKNGEKVGVCGNASLVVLVRIFRVYSASASVNRVLTSVGSSFFEDTGSQFRTHDFTRHLGLSGGRMRNLPAGGKRGFSS